MKRVLLGIFLLLAGPRPAAASEIVAVLSDNSRLYQQTVAEFSRALAASSLPLSGPRSIAVPEVESLLLTELAESAALPTLLRRQRPDLILALGAPALAAAREIGEIPILYLLAPNGPRLAAQQANITGINLIPAPADQLAAVQRLFPDRRRIGLITTGAGDPALGDEARRAAAAAGFSLVVRHCEDHRLIPETLKELVGQIDLFWLTADPDLLRRQYLQAIMLFSLNAKIPVFTFSELLLKEGATLAVSPDLTKIGAQAAHLSQAILRGDRPAPQNPEQLTSQVNRAVAAKLGLSLAGPARSGAAP